MAEKQRKRSEIDARYKWDLTHIYATREAWEAALEEVTRKVQAFAAYDGHVAEQPRQVIRDYFALNDELMPVADYAFLAKEADNGDPEAQAQSDRVQNLFVQASTACSFMEPELLALDEQLLKEMQQDPEMADYSEYLRSLLLQKPHCLPKEQERLLAMAGDLAHAPSSIYDMLTSVDMKFPDITLADGTTQQLTEGNYSTFIHSPYREERRQAQAALMNTYGSFGPTLASPYAASAEEDIASATAARYLAFP